MKRIIFLFFFISINAYAWPPLFGPEFTFTNDKIRKSFRNLPSNIINTAENEGAVEKFANLMIEKCKSRSGSIDDCNVVAKLDKYGSRQFRVQYKDGYWFEISVDPQLVEIQAKPSSRQEIENIKDRIQKDIFNSAKEIGIEPDIFASGGHIHIGSESAFADDARLFRNFMVDFANHPELANGVLDVNHMNAPPLSAHDEDVRKAFQQVINSFDMGEIKDMQTLSKVVNQFVYFKSFCEVYPKYKYQAMCLTRTAEAMDPKDMTVEIRSVRTQMSVDEYIKEMKLFEARIEYIKKITADGKNIDYLNLKGNMSDKEMVNAFYRYVVEAGLDWNEMKSLLPSYLKRKQVQIPKELGVKLIDPINKNKCVDLFSNPLMH